MGSGEPGVPGRPVVGGVARGAAVGGWAANRFGATPGGGSWGGAVLVVVEDCPLPSVEAATAGGSVANEGLAVSAGMPVTAEGSGS